MYNLLLCYTLLLFRQQLFVTRPKSLVWNYDFGTVSDKPNYNRFADDILNKKNLYPWIGEAQCIPLMWPECMLHVSRHSSSPPNLLPLPWTPILLPCWAVNILCGVGIYKPVLLLIKRAITLQTSNLVLPWLILRKHQVYQHHGQDGKEKKPS